MELHSQESADLPTRLLHWVAENQARILAGLVAVILLIAALAGWNALQSRRTEKGALALYKAADNKEALTAVAKDFAGSAVARLALVQLGGIYMGEKEADACLQNYETLYNQAGREVYFRVLALQGMGICQRLKGDFKKSAELFEKASKEPGNSAGLYNRFEAIRSLQAGGDPQAEPSYWLLLQEKDIPADLKAAVEEQLLWFKLSKKS